MNDKVVITGVGLVSSLGLSASGTWEALLAEKSGIQPIKDFDTAGFKCKAAAQVHGLNSLEIGIHPKDVRIMDKHSYMLMKCARDAFKGACLDSSSILGDDIGFFAGMGMVDYKIEDLLSAVTKSMDAQSNISYDAFFSHGYQEIHPLWPLSMLNNISFCQVATNLGIRGDNTVFSPHADSGAQAIAEGVEAVLDKKASVVLAGGVSEKVSPLSLARAHLAGILNTGGDDGRAGCRPFGAVRKGTILGEGCGILALERRSFADERGVSYRAVITGYGFAFETENGSSAPTAKALFCSMKRAIQSAGIKPSDIDVIIANGEGTYTADKNEIEAINQLFEGCIDRIMVYSSKGALGHLFAGAPAVDIILGICMLEYGIVPATLN